MKRMLLFSADSHASPRADHYRPYLESKYHSELDRVVAEQNHDVEERLKLMENTNSIQMQASKDDFAARAEFATQLDARLKAVEEDGFTGELIFPDNTAANRIPFTGRWLCGVGPESYMPDLWMAGLRAYNRWLGEHVTPDRQIGVGMVAFHDPSYALQQVQEFRELGLRGVMPQWDGLDSSFLPLYDEAFDPFWAACVEYDLPVTFHPHAGRPRDVYFGVDSTVPFTGGLIDTKATQAAMMYETEDLFWSRRTLWHLTLGGVLERHPGLKVGFVEMWTDWIPRTLERLDYLLQKASGRATKWEAICPRPASEYWSRQCFVGAHSWSVAEVNMRHELGIETVAYGTDFPHANSPWKRVKPFLQSTLGVAGVPESEARLMLGENMARIYNIDLAKLEPVVERIGPLPEEVLVVPADRDVNEELTPYMRFASNHPFTSVG